MKIIGLLLSLLTIVHLQAQNAFVDGVHASDVVEYKDGDIRFSASAFKLILTGTCDVSYTSTQLTTEKSITKTFIVKTSWNWRDVATIEIDTVKGILRLNGRGAMPTSKENFDTKEVDNDPDNNVALIYFKTKEMVRNAGKWVLGMVTTCGGNVKMIN